MGRDGARRADFVLTRINWGHKPGNALSAIEELDLAPDAFVLLDDNPVERALVTEHVPGVKAVDPAEPATRRGLTTWFDFPSTTLTEESRRRTEMYREAAHRRKALGQSLDYPTMMGSLGLRYSVRRAEPSDVERIRELIQRTNQFNTTTQRLSVDEIQRLVEDPATLVVTGRLADRFGDLGVVAVAVVDRERRTIDQVVMSCRAMGFGVELALVNRAVAMLGPDRPVHARFVATERNSPAADLFARCGFVPDADLWTWDAATPLVTVPEWLTEADS